MKFSPVENPVRAIVPFLISTALWAIPQQITINPANKATATLPASAPYSTLATFRVEWRATIPAAAATSAPAWAVFNQKFWVINDGGAGYAVRPYGLPFGNGPYTGFSYLVNSYQDNPNAQFICPSLSFGQDIVVRVQKRPTNMTCETWNVDGSNYQITSSTAFANVPGITNSLKIGDATYAQGTLAFFRGYSGNIALGSKPPFGGVGGDLWDYEFNGNLRDSSGHNLTLTPTGTFSYSTATTYPPACILPAQQSFRAGTIVTGVTAASSFPIDGGETLTYLWQQIPSNLSSQTGLAMPSVLRLSSQTTVNPTIEGMIAGSYLMQLTVTDSSGQQSTCSTKYGAVPTDPNGSVIVSNPVHAQILGPIIASFASPWAAEPQQHTAYAQLLIQKLAGTSPLQFEFVDYWNQAQAGTITVSNGSQAVVGVGTSFTTTFCQGPVNPTVPKIATSTAIVVWYPIANSYGLPTGTTGRRFGVVQSCTDDTHLTAQFTTDNTFTWITDANIGAGSGLSYAYVETNDGGPNGIVGWLFGGYPANYYDNVKALYALYYRTGIDDYLVAARTLADRWWSSPGIDKGIPYETTHLGNAWGAIAFQNRSMALTGLFMRNADNPPYDYGPGIRTIINALIGNSIVLTCPVGPVITTCGQDVREQGYALGWVALDALFDSSPAQVALDQAALSRDMNNRWGQCQANGGLCYNFDTINAFYASWNTGSTNFSATVINGSNIVTANGGTWNPANFGSCSPTPCSITNAPNGIWITSTGTVQPASNSQGDGAWYYVVYRSPTQLALTDVTGQNAVSYAGPSRSAAGWQTITYAQAQNPNFVGFFWQPFMTGILNQAYLYVSLALASSDPTNAANAAVWSLNNANAVATTGLNTSLQNGVPTNGPYYAIGIMCHGAGPGPDYPGPGCDSGFFGDRDLDSETLNVATIAYRLNPTSRTALTLGNTMMAAMWAQPGESGYDGANVLADVANPGFFYTAPSQHKWLGAFWGVGADWSWASTRLGGLLPPILRVVQVSLNYQNATQAVLTVTRPDGTSSQVTCTSSPCPVTIDAREGDHLLSIKYLNTVNQALLPAQQTILKAR